MNEQTHQRARKLVAQQNIESLSSDEQYWLEAHLAECESCAAEQIQLRESLSALRTMHLDLPPNLASRTQFRVRMRAEELREKEPAKLLGAEPRREQRQGDKGYDDPHFLARSMMVMRSMSHSARSRGVMVALPTACPVRVSAHFFTE